MEERLL